MSAVAASLATAHQLDAQRQTSEPRADVAIGVAMNGPADVNQRPKCVELGLPCVSPKTFPDFGLVAQAALYAHAHLAAVIEGSIYGNSWDSTATAKTLTNRVSALLVGARLATATQAIGIHGDTNQFRAFVQLIGGPEASTEVPTRFALQPGVGLDGKLRWEATWLRLTYDYRYTRGSGRNLTGSRISCGLAFTL